MRHGIPTRQLERLFGVDADEFRETQDGSGAAAAAVFCFIRFRSRAVLWLVRKGNFVRHYQGGLKEPGVVRPLREPDLLILFLQDRGTDRFGCFDDVPADRLGDGAAIAGDHSLNRGCMMQMA